MVNYRPTPNGGIEAVIDDTAGISKFYDYATSLSEELKVKFLDQNDHAESIDWDFQHNNSNLTLRYCMYNGVSIVQDKQHIPKKGDPYSVINEVLNYCLNLMG